jgi:undecaprenyl phosphate-alpha-L-ara4FN deformylase
MPEPSVRVDLGPRVVGLRVDVDTLRGTQLGVPKLLRVLDEHRLKASFFFSVGPDNMGRHLWRLLRPRFLMKMLRSSAPSLYGWDILLRGTLGPGPLIAKRLGEVMRAADQAGHELGLHAWDHQRWQAHIEHMPATEIEAELARGFDTLRAVLGREVRCSAAAGWRTNAFALAAQRPRALDYQSDCRGTSIFCPLLEGVPQTPQIPVTLPTYDELIGRQGITDQNFNAHMLRLIEPGCLNVLTVHAEVEGISRAALFGDFLVAALRSGINFVPLGRLLQDRAEWPSGSMAQSSIDGRDGWISMQSARV